MSHTPGPWDTENYTHEDDDLIGIESEDGGIAVVTVLNGVDIANARLIAAAPDLLEALKALIPDIEAVNKTDGQQIGWGRYENALAAIAKAEGK